MIIIILHLKYIGKMICGIWISYVIMVPNARTKVYSSILLKLQVNGFVAVDLLCKIVNAGARE